MGNDVSTLSRWVADSLPGALAALAILVVGWLVAIFVSGAVRGAVKKTKTGSGLAKWLKGDGKSDAVDLDKWAGTIAYYLVMFFVLVAFFQSLGLTFIAEPLRGFLNQIFGYAPRIIGAGILILVAWVIATIVKRLLLGVLSRMNIEERLGKAEADATTEKGSIAEAFASIVYWLIFLFFLPAVLSTLALEGLLVPVQNLFASVLGFLPNIIGAALILLLTWVVARMLQQLATQLSEALGVDRIGASAGLEAVMGEQTLSRLVGILIYAFVLIVGIIAALNTLALDAITAPASRMLEMILSALPAIFAAVLILGLAYFVGRILAGLVSGVLAGLGFNRILVKLGLAKESRDEAKTPSEIVGYLVLVAVMILAAIEASGLLGFTLLATLIAAFAVILGQVAVGLVIFGIGLYLAGVAYEAVSAAGGPQAVLLARISKVAILVLAGTMALSQMGIAQEIIFTAFAFILGGIILTAVIAFGVGGRDIASRELESWVERFKKKD
jgi:hypothetical protein